MMLCTIFSVQAATDLPIGKIESIPEEIAQLMIGKSWKPNCPVALEDLRYLTIPFWGYDDQIHDGHMVVHKKVADEVLTVFAKLLESRFPIEKMELIDLYDANDDLSMEVNNSSAFCSR